MRLIVLFLIGYLLGCVNFSIILSKLIEKKDVRSFGSGNAGFTNTLRNFKLSTAIMVFAGDALKAAVALTLAMVFAPADRIILYSAAVGVILGHNFPFVHGFKGGKGVLVSCVAVFFADWRIGLILLIASVLIMFITGYVSLGSVIGASLLPIITAILHSSDLPFIILSFIIAGLGIFMHRENIKRLITGTENRFRRKNNV